MYQYIAQLAKKQTSRYVIPVPHFNVMNGGKIAGNHLAVQEFTIIPTGANSFKEAIQMGSEVYHTLKSVIKHNYGSDATNVGEDGGFAPPIEDTKEALRLIDKAVSIAG